jgi:hypothetical protein
MDPRLARFLVASVALNAAHEVADHWLQTSNQACNKGERGWRGRRACAGHVASYTALQAVAMVGAAKWLGVPLSGHWTAVALGMSATTHYFADRRTPLIKLARRLGRGGYLDHVVVVREPGAEPETIGPGTGSFHLDQAWHYGWIFAAALVSAGRR